MDLILRNGKVVTPSGIVEADIGVSAGKIAQVGKISESASVEKDCTGLFILPGFIDMHVHFRDPGFPKKEDFASGSAAAAAGGVTAVIDMPNTNPPTLTCEALEEKRKIAASKSLVNFGFFFGLTYDNFEEIKRAQNIAGIKVYMGSSTGDLLVQDTRVIEKLFQLGKFVIVHAEDENIIRENAAKYQDAADPSVHSLIRSPAAAYEAVKSVLHLAKKYEARVHVTHVSTADEIEELRKFRGPLVSCDVTPHHLYLTQNAYAERGNYVKINPPLRTNKDRQALWKGLRDGVVTAIASDHAPHAKEEKEQSYGKAPAGAPGVETMLPLLLDSVNHGELSLRDIAQLTAENPARLLGIKNKGQIIAGFDADLAVVDINKETEVGANGFFTKCGWSPFSGWKLKGRPVMTIVGGQTVFENGSVNRTSRGKEIQF